MAAGSWIPKQQPQKRSWNSLYLLVHCDRHLSVVKIMARSTGKQSQWGRVHMMVDSDIYHQESAVEPLLEAVK